MAEANKSTDSEELNCLLCWNKFDTPRFLPCFHSFCERCLGEYITSNVQEGESFLCPVCEQKTFSPNPKLPIEEWASTFSLDNMIISIMELDEIPLGSSYKCDLCKREAEETDAEFWCSDCQEKMCGSCQRHHRRIKILQHHAIVPIEEMKDHVYIKLNFEQTCGCKQGNALDVYCIDHKHVHCVVCTSTTHRQCTKVRSLNEIVTEMAEKNLDAILLKGADIVMKNAQQLYDERIMSKMKIETDVDEHVENMDALCNELKDKISAFQVQFRGKATQIKQDMQKEVARNEDNLQKFRTNIKNSNHILKKIGSQGNPRLRFLVYQTITSQLKAHYCRLKNQLKDDNDASFALTIAQAVEQMKTAAPNLVELQISSTPSKGVDSFTRNTDNLIETMEARTSVKPLTNTAQLAKLESTPLVTTYVTSPDHMTCGTLHVTSVTRRETGLSNAWFNGGISLSNGLLLMVDCKNNKLVMFDKDYKYLKSFEVDDVPLSVKLVGEDIHLRTRKSIYQLTSQLQRIHKTRTNSLADETLTIGTDKIETSMSLDKTTMYYSNTRRSNRDHHVVISQANIKYYVHNDEIVCESITNGTTHYRYKHPKLQKPRGMCVDAYNILYVCNSENVHQISPNGKKGRTLLDKMKSIKSPYAAVWMPENNHLVITSHDEDTLLEVYRLY